LTAGSLQYEAGEVFVNHPHPSRYHPNVIGVEEMENLTTLGMAVAIKSIQTR